MTAFCLILPGEPSEYGATGGMWIDGDIEPVSDRHISLLLPELLHEGGRVAPIELIDEHDQLLLVSFRVQSVRVCTGVAHRHDAPPFKAIDMCRLHSVVPIAAQLAALHAQCLEHARRELVLSSLRSVADAYCVLDLDTRRVRWFYELDDDQPCTRSVRHDEERFLNLVETFHSVSSDDDHCLNIAAIGHVRVVRTIDLGFVAEFGASRSLAVALMSVAVGPMKLSVRERQVAKLLAAGYSTVNAAAIMSLSENTIRTYVRRLYRKLEITNRADLTRKCAELCLI